MAQLQPTDRVLASSAAPRIGGSHAGAHGSPAAGAGADSLRRRGPAGDRPRRGVDAKLPLWQRRAVIAAGIGLAATGLLWMGAEYGLTALPQLDGAGARSKLHLVLVMHGVLAYAAAVLVGSLVARHIPAGLQSGRRAWTGIPALVLLGGLGATGLLLYYAGSDALRQASSWIHQALGVIAVGVVWVHVARRERVRNARLDRTGGPLP